MNILVIGGMGFVGSNFIKYILKKYKNYKIINLDKLHTNNLINIERNSNYRFVNGEVNSKILLKDIIKVSDVVINFAAETHIDPSIRDPLPFIKNNIFKDDMLFRIAMENKIKRFIHISTADVYGNIEYGASKEVDALFPSSPYSASKASSDLLAISYFKTYKFPIIITRSSNNFGPFQYRKRVIPLFITNALVNKCLPIYGNGLHIRNWVYVFDHCRGIDLVLHKGKEGEIYNVGSNIEISNIDMAFYILDKLEKPKKLIKYIKDRIGHDKRCKVNYEKIKKIGFKAKYSYEKSMDETINWYKNNIWWWKTK